MEQQNEISVYKCGIVAKPKMHNAEGIITAALIRYGRITYELSYFHNGEYKNIWISEDELEIMSDEKQKVGFKTK